MAIRKVRDLSPEQCDDIKRLYVDESKSILVISNRMKIPYKVVSEHLRFHGLTRTPSQIARQSFWKRQEKASIAETYSKKGLKR
jgi:hypothetical protein